MDITNHIKSVAQIRRERAKAGLPKDSYNIRPTFSKVMCHYVENEICNKQSWREPHDCKLCHLRRVSED